MFIKTITVYTVQLLIVVVMVLVAAGLLALALIFIIKNKTVRRVCFYIVATLGIYIGYVGIRTNWPGFMSQVILAVLMTLTTIGSLVLERQSKGDEKKFPIARALASAALIVGMFNAFS